jgi:hypothetical protein
MCMQNTSVHLIWGKMHGIQSGMQVWKRVSEKLHCGEGYTSLIAFLAEPGLNKALVTQRIDQLSTHEVRHDI